jgi:O-antigen/teichoic acid export membrane protein
VPWLLGPEWELAGQFARVLAPMLYISAVATPVNMTLVVCGRQHWQFLWDSAKLAVVALMWWRVGDGGHNSMSAVLAYSAIASCFYLLHIVLSYRCLDLDGGEPCTKPTA